MSSDELIEAARAGNVARVREILRADPALADTRAVSGEAPIMGHEASTGAVLRGAPAGAFTDAAALAQKTGRYGCRYRTMIVSCPVKMSSPISTSSAPDTTSIVW
jgi:hypothetical protein